MRHWKIVAVVCFAVMAVAFGCLILYPEGDQKKGTEPESMETDTGQPETVSETVTIILLDSVSLHSAL